MARDVTFDSPRLPTQQSRVFAHDVAEVRSDKTEAAQILARGLSNFFGGAFDALDNVRAAEYATQQQKIEQENEQQRMAGQAMALRGQDLTDEQKQDLDYTQVYSKTLGLKYGRELATEYAAELSQLPLDQDPDNLKRDFLQRALKNGAAVGTGDDIFDAYILSSFEEAAAPAVRGHREARLKATLDKGLQEHDAAIGNHVLTGTFEPSDVASWIEERKALNPLDPATAAGDVVTAMIKSAGSKPAILQKVITTLQTPGTGDGTRSFAEMFPAAYQEAEEALVRSYETGLSWEGNIAYDELSKGLDLTDDPATLLGYFDALDVVKERYGKGGAYDGLRGKLMSKLEKVIETQVSFNNLDAMLTGQMDLDVSAVRKSQLPWLRAKGIDPQANPEAVAAAVSGFRFVVADDVKVPYSAALSDMTDPGRTAAGFRFYQAIEQRSNEAQALSMMEPEAREAYLDLKRTTLLRQLPLEQALTLVSENRAKRTSAGKLSLKGITGATSEEKGKQALAGRIRDKLGDVILDPAVEDLLIGEAQLVYERRYGSTPNGDWKGAVDDAIKASTGIRLVPSENGKTRAVVTKVPPFVAETDAFGNKVLDKDGQPKAAPVLPFAEEVFNPNTGKAENTLKTFREDMETIRRAMPDLKIGGVGVDSADEFGVTYDWPLATKGVALVTHDGSPVTITPGASFQINGQLVTIPKDPAEAEKFLTEFSLTGGALSRQTGYLAEIGFPTEGLVNNPVDDRVHLVPWMGGYVLAYRPGFKHRYPTVEELAQ
jgi:hypothetical protein